MYFPLDFAPSSEFLLTRNRFKAKLLFSSFDTGVLVTGSFSVLGKRLITDGCCSKWLRENCRPFAKRRTNWCQLSKCGEYFSFSESFTAQLTVYVWCLEGLNRVDVRSFSWPSRGCELVAAVRKTWYHFTGLRKFFTFRFELSHSLHTARNICTIACTYHTGTMSWGRCCPCTLNSCSRRNCSLGTLFHLLAAVRPL